MSEVETGALGGGRVESRELEQEMRSSFLDYAMSVIVSRALPDVRDGLKPVHRRVLYGMHEDGLQPNRPYKKSAATVGTVMSRYHPHSDSAIYDTLVRMAQPFSLRYPLVDGQGNFGSIDEDPAAAMRYTEARLSRIATELLRDIDANTLDFEPNYDESRRHARPGRAEARRDPAGRPQQSLQAHAAPVDVRLQRRRPRRRRAEDAVAARARPTLSRLPARGRHPPLEGRAAQGGAARARARGLPQGPRQQRCDRRSHSRCVRRRRRQDAAHGPFLALGGPGAGDPRSPPGAPYRAC